VGAVVSGYCGTRPNRTCPKERSIALPSAVLPSRHGFTNPDKKVIKPHPLVTMCDCDFLHCVQLANAGLAVQLRGTHLACSKGTHTLDASTSFAVLVIISPRLLHTFNKPVAIGVTDVAGVHKSTHRPWA
jgi:hypothetical protein